VAVILGTGLVPASAQDAGSALDVTLLRTWESADLTVVDGLVSVPLSIFSAATTDTYRFELAVFDAAGTQLYSEGWEREVGAALDSYRVEGVALLEAVQFGIKPGRYEVELRAYATDSPTLGVSARVPIEAYAEVPVASDLFLASRVEPLREEAVDGGWSVTHAGYGIAAASSTRVLPDAPDLYYYLELYGRGGVQRSVAVAAEVLGENGRVVYRTPEKTVSVAASGSPFTGHLSLVGLPPGDYTLAMQIEGEPGGPPTVSSPFRMVDHEQLASLEVTEGPQSAYLSSLSDKELAATFGGVSQILSDTERRLFEELPPDAMRRYLADFFHRQDPDRSTPHNEFFEEYIERVGTIRMKYGEDVGTTEREPWRTDRGRIYLRYGEPNTRIAEYFPADAGLPTTFGGEPPYEIWRYNDTGFAYLFVQENRAEGWRLIYSTDTEETTLADWWRRAGGSAMRDLRDNFGIRPLGN
jgi:GWxTD domain-containing protein